MTLPGEQVGLLRAIQASHLVATLRALGRNAQENQGGYLVTSGPVFLLPSFSGSPFVDTTQDLVAAKLNDGDHLADEKRAPP